MESPSWLQLAAAGLIGMLFLIFRRSYGGGSRLPPGPWALPIIGHMHLLGKYAHRSLIDLANKYGPIMSIKLGSVYCVVVSNSDMAKQFLQVHDQNFASRPTMLLRQLLWFGGVKEYQGIALLPYGDLWRYNRKIVTLHLLTQKRITQFQDVRKWEIIKAIRNIMSDSKQGKGTSLKPLLTRIMSNNIYNMMNRGPRTTTDSEMAVEFGRITSQIVEIGGAFGIADYIPWLKPFDPLKLEDRAAKLCQRINVFLQDCVDQHRMKAKRETVTDANEDFVDALLNLPNETGTGFISDFAAKSILSDMMVAGTETSGSTVEWIMTELIRNPLCLKKAQEELAAVVGLNRLVEESDIPKLHYLNNVVKETARLHPQAPLLIPHESTQKCSVAGYDIPAKTRLFVNVMAIGLDPTVWPNPQMFDPERFDRTKIDMKGTDFELLPFGAGRRICPGMNLGLAMVNITLAHLLHTFNWALPSGMRPDDINMTERQGLSLAREVSLTLCATPRLSLPRDALLDM